MERQVESLEKELQEKTSLIERLNTQLEAAEDNSIFEEKNENISKNAVFLR